MRPRIPAFPTARSRDIRHSHHTRPAAWLVSDLFRDSPSIRVPRKRAFSNPPDPRIMLYETFSAALYGIDANIIQVALDCSGMRTDQDHLHTVGLPDAAVSESRGPGARRPEKLRPRHSPGPGHHPPRFRRYKEGRLRLDLPIALGSVGAYRSESCPLTARGTPLLK